MDDFAVHKGRRRKKFAFDATFSIFAPSKGIRKGNYALFTTNMNTKNNIDMSLRSLRLRRVLFVLLVVFTNGSGVLMV
jgi:hypothetical protein